MTHAESTTASILRRAAELVAADANQLPDEPLDVHDYIRQALFGRGQVLDADAYWTVRRALRDYLDAVGVQEKTPLWSDSVSPAEMAEALRAAADRHEQITNPATSPSPSVARDPFTVAAA